jgi:hypothetical protein
MLLPSAKQVLDSKEITIQPSYKSDCYPTVHSAFDELKHVAISIAKEAINDRNDQDVDVSYKVIFTYIDDKSKTVLIQSDSDIFIALKNFIKIGYVKVSADVYTTNIQPKKQKVFLPVDNHENIYTILGPFRCVFHTPTYIV